MPNEFTHQAHHAMARNEREAEFNQARYLGCGSADTTPEEWHRNIIRDTCVSQLGHPAHLQYSSIAHGLSREQTRVQILERMIAPTARINVSTRLSFLYIQDY
jgi:hypothetical protein